jgi:hypothetical protein
MLRSLALADQTRIKGADVSNDPRLLAGWFFIGVACAALLIGVLANPSESRQTNISRVSSQQIP